MAQKSSGASPAQRFGVGRIAWWFLVLISAALLVFLIVSEVIRFSTPIPLHRLQIVQDIPLPDALPDPHRTSQNPFASGEAQRFDHFDFQSLDPATHLLFIVHTGPTRINRPLSHITPISMREPTETSLSSILSSTRLLGSSAFPKAQAFWSPRILARSLSATLMTVSSTLLTSIAHSTSLPRWSLIHWIAPML